MKKFWEIFGKWAPLALQVLAVMNMACRKWDLAAVCLLLADRIERDRSH